MKSLSNERGFTLVELLFTMAIITVDTAVTTGAFSTEALRHEDTKRKSALCLRALKPWC